MAKVPFTWKSKPANILDKESFENSKSSPMQMESKKSKMPMPKMPPKQKMPHLKRGKAKGQMIHNSAYYS